MSLIHLTEKLLYINKTLCITRNIIISHVGQISVQIRDFHSNKRNAYNMSKKQTLKTFHNYFIVAYCYLWIHLSFTFF